jgi:hypothetical protein
MDTLLCNDESEEVKNELPYIKEHLNSLNINITAPFVETMFEAMKIYSGKIYEAQPYLLVNKTGLPLELRETRI